MAINFQFSYPRKPLKQPFYSESKEDSRPGGEHSALPCHRLNSCSWSNPTQKGFFSTRRNSNKQQYLLRRIVTSLSERNTKENEQIERRKPRKQRQKSCIYNPGTLPLFHSLCPVSNTSQYMASLTRAVSWKEVLRALPRDPPRSSKNLQVH